MSTAESKADILRARAPRSAWRRYLAAVASVSVAWLAREALTLAVGPSAIPFIFFFPAVAAATWYGGLGAGLLAVGLSAMVANWFFINPVHSLSITGSDDLVAVGAFLASSAIIIAAMEATRRARVGLVLEIAERRRAESALAESHDILQTTLASIGDGVIVTDAVGHVTFLNAEAERLTGWATAEAAGQPLPTVFQIINEDTGQSVESPAEKVFRIGGVVGLANHTILISRDGTRRLITDSGAPIRRHGGPIFGVVLVFRDATAQRSSDLAQARLAAIVENSGDAIVTKNLNGVIQTWNAAAERLFGYAAGEAIGKPITLIVPEDHLSEEVEILRRLRSGLVSERIETLRRRKDGHLIPVSVSVSPIRDRDGRVIGASKIAHDITDIVAARQALDREREVLATTLASIGDGVVVTNARGQVTFLNPSAAQWTGWTDDEARGQELSSVFRIVNEQTRETVENPVEKALRQGGVVGLANHTVLLAKDGLARPIDDSAAPIRLADGSLEGVVLVFRDVTERRRAEQALHEADRRKDEFLAVLSHELRNPLAPIRMAVAILHKIGPPQHELRQLRDIIDRQTEQLTRLLDDLLDVSRIALGKIPLRKDRLSVAVAVSSAVEAVRPHVDAQDQTLTVSSPDVPVEVEGDLGRLAQIFANLLNNASKYTPKGGTITVTIARENGDAVVRVRDSGVGIASDQLERIFEMFAQVDQPLEVGQRGLGVGLSLARKLVELHGGQIHAQSQGIGKGSEFIVRLPAMTVPSVTSEAAADPAAEPSPGLARRVLVADDNEDSALVLATALRHAGHTVATAHDGPSVVRLADAFDADVAILDIGMPGIDGYEVARRFRAARGHQLLLIAMTGWGQEEDKRRAREAGFDHHLTKPVDLRVLYQLLARAPHVGGGDASLVP